MGERDRTPLSPRDREALALLTPVIDSHEQGLSRTQAYEVLVEEGFTAGRAETAVETLLRSGYLYAVDDTLFVT
jgi:hypothetical protein